MYFNDLRAGLRGHEALKGWANGRKMGRQRISGSLVVKWGLGSIKVKDDWMEWVVL